MLNRKGWQGFTSCNRHAHTLMRKGGEGEGVHQKILQTSSRPKLPWGRTPLRKLDPLAVVPLHMTKKGSQRFNKRYTKLIKEIKMNITRKLNSYSHNISIMKISLTKTINYTVQI